MKRVKSWSEKCKMLCYINPDIPVAMVIKRTRWSLLYFVKIHVRYFKPVARETVNEKNNEGISYLETKKWKTQIRNIPPFCCKLDWLHAPSCVCNSKSQGQRLPVQILTYHYLLYRAIEISRWNSIFPFRIQLLPLSSSSHRPRMNKRITTTMK